MSGLEARLRHILRQAPSLMRVLTTARDLALPDWMVFSGAVYQPAWNHLTGRPPEHGIADYDLAFFDASDISYEAEDLVIRRVVAAFEPPLREMVEARNQARVHLWFEGKFGEAYAPLGGSAEALTRFTSPAFAVGARLEVDDPSPLWRRSASKTCSPCASAPIPCAPAPASPAPWRTRDGDGRRWWRKASETVS